MTWIGVSEWKEVKVGAQMRLRWPSNALPARTDYEWKYGVITKRDGRHCEVVLKLSDGSDFRCQLSVLADIEILRPETGH